MSTELDVWGHAVVLTGFDHAELEEIRETFAGGLRPGAPPGVTLNLVRQHTTAGLSGLPTRPRHRGGSSARKFFLDGSLFVAGEQRRDISVVTEGIGADVYYAESPAGHGGSGAVVVVQGHQVTLAASGPLPPMLLSDVIEDWLLCRIRRAPAVQVHCAAWLDSGEATVVVGSSGAGKTTELFRHMAGGGTFLSNDRAFLRIRAGVPEVRSFPLPVNVGCGTIRSLGLDLPHRGRDDHDKIRLRPPEVVERYGADYEGWYPVAALICRSRTDLLDNIYWVEDDCHPFWVRAWRPEPVGDEFRDELLALLEPKIVEQAAVLG
jgi:hypothetical protein